LHHKLIQWPVYQAVAPKFPFSEAASYIAIASWSLYTIYYTIISLNTHAPDLEYLRSCIPILDISSLKVVLI